MKSLLYIFLFIPLTQSFAQVDLSGYVTFPDSVGIDLIRVEVWQNNQQLASTITDSLGYFEIDSILTGVEGSTVQPNEFNLYPNYPSPLWGVLLVPDAVLPDEATPPFARVISGD